MKLSDLANEIEVYIKQYGNMTLGGVVNRLRKQALISDLYLSLGIYTVKYSDEYKDINVESEDHWAVMKLEELLGSRGGGGIDV